MDLLSDIIDKPTIAPKTLRICAFVIDISILAMIALILGIFYGERIVEGDTVGYRLTGIPAFAWFSLAFCLVPLLEGVTGRTIGKRLLKIHVVKTDYSENSLGASIARHLFDVVDMLFLVGLIVASVNAQKRRIGDLVAGTLVVRD